MKAAAGTSRLFLALWPDEATREALAHCRDAWGWDRAAVPQRAQQLHLTLHFLGAVPQQRVPDLVDGLCVAFSPFTLQLDLAQCWRNGVALLAPAAVPPALLALHDALRDALVRLNGAAETRPWRPHLTLARHAGGSVAPAQVTPVQWPVRGYALMESNAVTGDYIVLRHYQ